MPTATFSRRTIGYAAAGAAAVALLAVAMPEVTAADIEALALRLGPVAIVLLLALAIVVSPIPSGPVAMVAGALYGTAMGGALTIAGALLGAVLAFGITRQFGRQRLCASNARIADFVTRPRSQAGLMGVIFVSRLIPFISFDAVSYLAGLTPIAFWRFALATTAGTTPVCVAFAAMGAGAASAGPLGLALASGITLALPVALGLWRLIPKRAAARTLISV